MVWMETTLATADIEQVLSIQEQVAEARAALPEAERGAVALFSRDDGGGRLRLLLSPSAENLTLSLAGVWRPSPGPQALDWTMICGGRGAHKQLGVKPASARPRKAI